MPTLTLKRDSGRADDLRTYEVVIDGEIIGRIRRRETAMFLLSGGRHELQIKMDWWGSPSIQFSVAEIENVTFHVKSNLTGGLFELFYYAIFARNQYLRLDPETRERELKGKADDFSRRVDNCE